jgi:hypothetical protein
MIVLAFGGIVFLLAAVVLVAIVGWVVVSYLTGTAEAADDGLDPDVERDDHHDAGHVAGPQSR